MGVHETAVMTAPEVPSWATDPIDLSHPRTRRLFAQELVTRLAPIGSVTLEEARALGLTLFKVPPTRCRCWRWWPVR